MLILNTIYIENKKICLINKTFVQTFKRFTGNKKPGHVHKIMNILNNKKQAQVNTLNISSKKVDDVPKINEVPFNALSLKNDKELNQTNQNGFLAGLKNSMNYIVSNSLSDAAVKNGNQSSRFLADKNISGKPPKFVVIEVSEDFRKADNEGSPLPSYELNHLLIMEVNSGIVFAQCTSSKHAPDNFKISEVKLDGSSGNQYISIFKYTRRFSYNEEFNTCGYKINDLATKILNDNQDYYNFIKDKFNDYKHRDSVDRVHKHDSRFYEENGARSEPESTNPLPTKNLKMEKLLAVLLNKTHIDDDVIKSSE